MCFGADSRYLLTAETWEVHINAWSQTFPDSKMAVMATVMLWTKRCRAIRHSWHQCLVWDWDYLQCFPHVNLLIIIPVPQRSYNLWFWFIEEEIEDKRNKITWPNSHLGSADWCVRGSTEAQPLVCNQWPTVPTAKMQRWFSKDSSKRPWSQLLQTEHDCNLAWLQSSLV